MSLFRLAMVTIACTWFQLHSKNGFLIIISSLNVQEIIFLQPMTGNLEDISSIKMTSLAKYNY